MSCSPSTPQPTPKAADTKPEAPAIAGAPSPDIGGLRISATFNPATPSADAPTSLTYLVTREDGSVPDLVESHTKFTHLIVVSHDLSSFQHVHPEQTSPGTFQIDLAWPFAGDYVLFADATPAGGATHIERIPVTVKGDGPPAVTLTPSPRELEVDGYSVHLESTPAALVAGEATLTFHLSKAGQPLTTLQPYLGAMGHLVVLSADTEQFLHAHPADDGAPQDKSMATGEPSHDAHGSHGAPAATTASTVAFGTAFPSPGLYKAWGQFLIDGQIITAPFVLEVG